MSDLLKILEERCNRELIKYACSKQMFCEATGKILDCKKCIMIEALVDGKTV